MILTRVIPTLLIKGNKGLHKGIGFKNHRYVGDPLNAVRIFNSKEVDELMILDITATKEGRTISEDFVRHVSSECFMPLAIGGGIKTVEQAVGLIKAGAEKIVINSAAIENLQLVSDIADVLGQQCVVLSIDVKKLWSGKNALFTNSGTVKSKLDLKQLVVDAEVAGVGEILVTSIDYEGTRSGYNADLVKEVSGLVTVPVIANGGAGKIGDFFSVVKHGGAHAAAAGSFFVFYGAREAVLISFPEERELTIGFQQS